MAKIIGHYRLWRKAICDKCNAIILFEDAELVTHNRIDRWNEPVYDHSEGICPECSNVLTFNKYHASFVENIDEPICEIKST